MGWYDGGERGCYRLVLVRGESDGLAVEKVWRRGLLGVSRLFVWSEARGSRD